MSERMEKRFSVTEDHLLLARAMNVGWCGDEFGAPQIDPKRPYGNSDTLGDIEKITGRSQPNPHRLHREMETVLQIILATGYFREGDYVADEYRRNWRFEAE